MKVKLGTIQLAQSGFVTLMKSSMPIKLSYAVSKNVRKIATEAEDIEKFRQELIKKYGKEDGKGGIQVTPENSEVFNKEYGEFMDQEIEIDLWKISLSKMAEAGVRITPEQMLSLEDFIDNDIPEPNVPVVPKITSDPIPAPVEAEKKV